MALEDVSASKEEDLKPSTAANPRKNKASRIPRIDPTALAMLAIIVGGSALTAFVAIRVAMPKRVVVQVPSLEGQEHGKSFNLPGLQNFTTGPNVPTSFNVTLERPTVAEGAYVHPQASVVGFVSIERAVFIAPNATLRGDVGQNIKIAEESNVQPGVVIQGEATEANGRPQLKNQVVVNGQAFSVYVGRRVSIDAQAQVHGPSALEEDVYVGMQALVQHARVGKGSVIAPRAAVIGVTVPPGRYVPVGQIVTQQAQADALPPASQAGGYVQIHRNLVKASVELAAGYLALHTPGGKGLGKPVAFDDSYWASEENEPAAP